MSGRGRSDARSMSVGVPSSKSDKGQIDPKAIRVDPEFWREKWKGIGHSKKKPGQSKGN